MASRCKKVVLGFHRAAFNRTRPIAQPHKAPMAPLRFHGAYEAPNVDIDEHFSSLNAYISTATNLLFGVGGFLVWFNGGIVIKFSESTVERFEKTMKSVEATMKSVEATRKSVEATVKSMEKGK